MFSTCTGAVTSRASTTATPLSTTITTSPIVLTVKRCVVNEKALRSREPTTSKRSLDGTTGDASSVGAGVASGLAVGTAVGTAVGAAVGTAVGAAVGTAVGIAVGTAVGTAVGVAVGAAVGTYVGIAVGEAVGAIVVSGGVRSTTFKAAVVAKKAYRPCTSTSQDMSRFSVTTWRTCTVGCSGVLTSNTTSSVSVVTYRYCP